MLKDFDSLLEKVEKIKKDKTWDLSSDEDLSVAVMNLISIEEHLFFTAQKTGKKEYFDFLNQVRKMRKEFLAKIVKRKEGEIWCLPPKTIIYTNPKPKPISRIAEGEEVLTHGGKFLPVKHVFVRNYEGSLISIAPYYGGELLITPKHLVLCATNVRRKQKDLWRKNFVKPNIVWKKAAKLENTDFLLFPRFQDEKNIKEMNIEYSWTNKGCFKPTTFRQEKTIKVDKGLMQLIGLYISEGSISERIYYYKNKRKTGANLYFSFGKREKELIELTKFLFKKVFGIPLKVSETKSTIDLVCSHRIVVRFFREFGRKSNEKVLPFWILKLPSEKLLSLIWGLVKGDGNEDKYRITYFTSSDKLAYQLRLLLFKIGIIHSLKETENRGGEIDGRKIIQKSPAFTLGISGDAARLLKKEVGLDYTAKRTSGNFGYVLDDFIMIPIRKIRKVKYSGEVYNLQVESETYTTHTGVVHNCISKHLLAASMRLIEVGTKELKKGNKVEAYNLFKKSFELYSLFWGINLDLVKSDDLQETLKQEEMEISGKEKVDLLGKIGNIVKKILNCCKE